MLGFFDQLQILEVLLRSNRFLTFKALLKLLDGVDFVEVVESALRCLVCKGDLDLVGIEHDLDLLISLTFLGDFFSLGWAVLDLLVKLLSLFKELEETSLGFRAVTILFVS